MPEENARPAPIEIETADDLTVRSLLARANLLRMRAQWTEAISACTDALRHDPRSASAHSLLGDIYEAQGNYDDAAQWFGMALEIDPANASDRAKRDRMREIQRVRLRTQDIAQAAAGKPSIPREKTLEWFDRVFPPSRSDSLPRLILAMGLAFAALIAACAGFIYFFIVPHHTPASAAGTGSFSTEMSISLAMPAPPVVMMPSQTGESSGSGAIAVASAAAGGSHGNSSSEKVMDKSVTANIAAHFAATTTSAATADLATLRTRLAPQLNSTEVQIAGISYGENGAIYLDLILAAVTGGETTERLRERALRAASQAAHALAGLLPAESPQRTVVRIARLVSPAAVSPGARLKSYDMVFQAETPLRYFRSGEVATMTTSDLMGRFQNAQWYAAGASPLAPATGAAGNDSSNSAAATADAGPPATPTPAPNLASGAGGALATH